MSAKIDFYLCWVYAFFILKRQNRDRERSIYRFYALYISWDTAVLHDLEAKTFIDVMCGRLQGTSAICLRLNSLSRCCFFKNLLEIIEKKANFAPHCTDKVRGNGFRQFFWYAFCKFAGRYNCTIRLWLPVSHSENIIIKYE